MMPVAQILWKLGKKPAELGVLSRCGPPDVSGILFDREMFSTSTAVPRNFDREQTKVVHLEKDNNKYH